MALFLDTSALVKLFVPERGSEEVSRAVSADSQVLLGCLSRHEFLSAIHRRMRMGTLSSSEASEIRERFSRMVVSVTTIPFSQPVSDRAIELLDRHGPEGLRTLDAVQLACAVEETKAVFCAADRLLVQVAGGIGRPVLFIG